MKINKLVLAALISSVFFVSCNNDDNDDNDLPKGIYDNGVLILNQGGFQKSNASISYLSEDFVTQQNDIFSLVNPSISLGDTGQSIGFYKDLAFIVLNGSNKIEVVNRYTMAHVQTITTGLDNPRYIAFSNGKGFVTNWGDGNSTTDDFVAVLNLATYAMITTIPVAEGPEKIIEENNILYVAHQGGFGFGNRISVISGTLNGVTATINVGDVPNSLDIENGSLYVLCGGKPNYALTETAGNLVKINLSNNTVSSTINFAAKTHPSNFVVEDNAVFYTIGSSVYKTTLNATTLPTTALFTTTAEGVQSAYSFAVEDDKIYVGDSGDNKSNGKIYIYSAAGILEHNYTVGIIPAGFYFND